MKPALQYHSSENLLNHSDSRLVQAIRRFLRSQFGCPAGLCGNIAGKIMAYTPSNQDRIRWTLSLLDIRPDDRLLEVGFGPGLAVELASQIACEGFIAGIDHSEVMVRQASKRNARAIRDERVTLQLGSAVNLPKFKEPFDKIFTINSIRRFLGACSEVTLQREEREKPWCLTDNALPYDTPQLAAGRLHFISGTSQ